MMRRSRHKFVKESALCDVFMASVATQGWVSYPEAGNWDIVLIPSTPIPEHPDIQIGVQAKLKANLHVMVQSIPYRGYHQTRTMGSLDKVPQANGPDIRAVLIPSDQISGGFLAIARATGLWVFTDTGLGHDIFTNPSPAFNWKPKERVWLPDTIPQVKAGSSAPVSLTHWKQGVLRLIARAMLNGHVTTRDAKDLGVTSPTLLTQFDWFRVDGKIGRANRLVLSPTKEISQYRSGQVRPDLVHVEEFKFYLNQPIKE